MCVFFQVESPVTLGASVWGLATADLNADGVPDAVAALTASNQIDVLISNGAGGFSKTTAFAAGTGPTALALGNIFGGSAPDVVVADGSGGTVDVLKDTGGGSFAAPVSYSLGTGSDPTALALADLNGDGKTDIAVAETGTNKVAVLLNNGSGGFGTAVTYAVGAAPSAIVADVLNASKLPSLIVADGGSNQITVLPEAGGGAFGAGVTYSVGQNPTAIAMADFFATGWKDVAVAAADGSVTLFTNTGNGKLTADGTLFVAGDATCIVAADINADGLPDLIVGSSSGGSYQVSIFVNNGMGGFFQPPLVYSLSAAPVSLAVANVTADGRADILATLGNGSVDVIVHAPDSYAWTNPAGGAWGTAGNWEDTTTPAPATTAPGASNAVTIDGSAQFGSFTDITGNGAAASLNVGGNVLLWGTVAVGNWVSLSGTADLELDGGASLTASSLYVGYAGGYGDSNSLEVTGGSSLTVSGYSQLASNAFLLAVGGSKVQLASLVGTGSANASANAVLAVDDVSSIEVGTAGSAALGALTVDKTVITALGGSIDGNLVLAGTIAVPGGAGLSVDSYDPFGTATTISGDGSFVLSESSRLTLGVADSAAIMMNGPADQLTLDVLPSGTISGFGLGDVISLGQGMATALKFKQTSTTLGTLTLTKGSKTVGTLALAGNFGSDSFHMSFDPYGDAVITLRSPGTAAVQPGVITGTAAYEYLHATASNQTLTGNGGGDQLDTSGFTAITFKDSSANLSGSTIDTLGSTDIVDLTDMAATSAAVTFEPPTSFYQNGNFTTVAQLLVNNGTHSADIYLSGSVYPLTTLASDGAGGAKLTFQLANPSATGNGQTLYGLGVTHALYGNSELNIVFKDTSANSNGDGLFGFDPSDRIVLTDMTAAKATDTYTPGVYTNGTYSPPSLLVTDGTHSATLSFPNSNLPAGLFLLSADATAGTDLTFEAAVTTAYTNGQTLYGLGVAHSLDGNGYSNILLKDSVANLNGDTFTYFTTSDSIDATNLTFASASVSFTNGTLSLSDGTHSATITITDYYYTGYPPLGIFTAASDGAGGTLLSFESPITSATGNNQTLDTLGVTNSLNANGYTGVVIKDTSADLSGVEIFNFNSSVVIDLTDLKPASVSAKYLPPYYYYYPGTLTVAGGGLSSAITLSLYAGSLAPGYFAVSSDGAGGSDLTYTTLNTDAMTFSNTLGGSVATAANWQDTTAGTVATAAPSYGNAITIGQLGDGYTNVSGAGAAASLITTGDVLLRGSLSIGAVYGSGGWTQSNTTDLDGGASLAVAGTASISGVVQVGGGSKLAAGTIAFGPTNAALLVVGGSTATAGGLNSRYSSYSAVIAVDAASVLEDGSAGGATKGALTVDSGITASLSGTVEAAVVVNGVLQDLGSLTLTGFAGGAGGVSGSGTLQIGSYGTLTLASADSAVVQFGTSGGSLVLAGALPSGTIAGFGAGQSIVVDQTVTALSYAQTTTSAGTLTLSNGSKTIGTLTLAGSYSAAQFLLQPGNAGAAATISYTPVPSTANGLLVSTNSDTFYWASNIGGAWGYAGNWTDNGATASAAPGANNPVYFYNRASQIISGSGSAASLTTQYGGAYGFTGNITVGGAIDFYAPVVLSSGAAMTGASLYTNAAVAVDGASLSISGTSAGQATISGSITVVGGGRLTVAGPSGGSVSYSTLAVDPTSTAEFGSAGKPAAGTLAIDSGQTLTSSGTLAANLLVNGTLYAYGTIEGFGGGSATVGGTGSIVMTGNLLLNGASSAGIVLPSVSYYSYAATLELAGPLPTGAITLNAGFSAYYGANIIRVDHTVTGVSFVQTTATQGTLTLTNGAATVGTLALAGSYTGWQFHVDVTPGSGVAQIIAATAPAAAGTSAVSTSTDAYTWNGASGAVWSTAGNWRDSTTNAVPTTVPGKTNAVSITGSKPYYGGVAYLTVGGSGAAASLAISNAVLLPGTVAVSGLLSTATGSTLAVDAGKLTAGSAQITGTLEAGKASTVTVTGTATLAGGVLEAMAGSAVQIGGLIGNGAGNVIAIDANTVMRIGSPNTAAAGALTQQTGTTAAFAGTIFGSLTANGLFAVPAGAALEIDMAGTAEADPYGTPAIGGIGTLSISESATLGLGAALASTATLQFNGPYGTLQLAALPGGNITGFAAGDSIVVDKAVTGLSYAQTTSTTATLTLTNGATTVGKLVLNGSYSTAGSFHLDVAPSGTSATITLQTIGVAATQPTLITGTAAQDTLLATANSQTLTGLGGQDSFNGSLFTGLDFKDLTANLNACSIVNFDTSDVLDFTDMTSTKATASYSGGLLTVSDGTHSAKLALSFNGGGSSGTLTTAGDGGSGTKVYWH